MISDHDWCVQVQDEHVNEEGGSQWEVNNWDHHVYFYWFYFFL